MKKFIFAALFAIVPFIAFAESTNVVGDAVSGLLSDVVFPVISAFLLGLVGIILVKIKNKYHVELSKETELYIEKLASQGIGKAEEIAASWAKNNTDKITGREKLDIAIAHIIEKVPKISNEQAKSVVHSVLSKIDGYGASGKK